MAKTLVEECKEVEQRIDSNNDLLGIGLMQPFGNTNSAPRKIMHAVHEAHAYTVLKPEVPLISTSYETKYGQFSSAFNKSDSHKRLLCKIPKFNYPRTSWHHYYAIFYNEDTNKLELFERVDYSHRTESYGFMYDNSYVDSMIPGDTIQPGEVYRKSSAFDEYNNRQCGVNLNVAYMSMDLTQEDGVVLSESAAKKLGSSLIKPMSCTINDNDVMLNLYGDSNFHKVIPDIGERVKDGIVCAIRQEKKNQALFSQSYERLSTLLPSDAYYVSNADDGSGVIVDINVNCNNPESLAKSPYNKQLKAYYDDAMETKKVIVNMIDQYLDTFNCEMDYDLNVLYTTAKMALNGAQYIKDRIFSNINLEITVLESNPMKVGDKIANRHGGKSVVTAIWPDEMMPMMSNGDRVELLTSTTSPTRRNNYGCVVEPSINHVGSSIVHAWYTGILGTDQMIDEYLDFLRIVSPEQYEYMKPWLDTLDDDDTMNFIRCIMDDDCIYVSVNPLTTDSGLGMLMRLYERFPQAQQEYMQVPVVGSDGTVRMVYSRRPTIVGKAYYIRLKQYAEEKFSATSLSAININGENARNRASKDYMNPYPKTPIRAGEMEIGDLEHAGTEAVVINLMLVSASSQARKLFKKMITGDPVEINVNLDNASTNANAEKVATYLKSIGLRLSFKKVYYNAVVPFFSGTRDNPKEFDRTKMEEFEKEFIGGYEFVPEPTFYSKRPIDPICFNKTEEEDDNERDRKT